MFYNISVNETLPCLLSEEKKMLRGKDGLSSLIVGGIFLVLNCIMLGLALTGNGFLFGGILILVPIAGIITGFTALKQGGSQKIMGIIGILLNAFNTLVSIAVILLGLLSKASN